MVTTLTEFITVSRPIGKGNDNILEVALNTYNFNLTEFRVKSNAVHKENISKNHWTVLAQHAQTGQDNRRTRT